MKIIITEEQKKKLFIPRRISGENSKWMDWNKEQPIKNGEPINQYTHDGKKEGYWEDYWKDNKIQSKGLYVNDKQEGIWRYYYLNGQLHYMGSFINGMEDGLWVYYDENGQLESKGTFINGEMDGVWEDYYDGKLDLRALYKNGEIVELPTNKNINETETPKKKLFVPRRLSGENSRYAQWNKEQPIVNGKPINQYDMDGLKQGNWEEYWNNGEIEERGSYKDGKEDGIWEKYWSNGQLQYKGSYKNGERYGVWEWYNYDGQLEFKSSYENINESETPKKKLFIPRRLSGENSKWLEWNKEQIEKYGIPINQYTHDGLRTGVWEDYWPSGQLASKGPYKDDKAEGIWEFYFDNGEIRAKGSFKDGKMNGMYERYYNNGQLQSKGSYEDDIKQGLWKLYWFNGKLAEKGSYVNNDADGIWEEYNENGQLETKKLYKNGEYVKQLPITKNP